MREFDTNWDPYDALIQCQNNIEQCAVAINYGSELIKELGDKYRHQQEVIQQLQLINRKLTAQINFLVAEIQDLKK